MTVTSYQASFISISVSLLLKSLIKLTGYDVIDKFRNEIKRTFKLSYLCCSTSIKILEMTIRKSVFKYFFLFVILVPVSFSCTEKNLKTGNGVLKGKISIGPICPVQKDPPDPACLPAAETYKAWATAVWTVNKKTKVATLDPTLDGNYQIGLPMGNYIIDYEVARTNSIGGSNLPANVSITNIDTTTFNIDIDTGIR